MLLCIGACGDLPQDAWVLQEEPRVLAFRSEVEPGPFSDRLLPIPADRVRNQPLPLDTVEVDAWVVSADGEWDLSEIEPAWFLCPRGACLSTLGLPGAGEPCGEGVPEDVACRLPTRGDVARFAAPVWDPEIPLLEQGAFQVEMVGHYLDDVTTEDCIRSAGDRAEPSLHGCIIGYDVIAYGPRVRTYSLGLEQGLELPDFELPPTEFDVPVVPHHNPEIVPLSLVPLFEPLRPDLSRVRRAHPYETTPLEPGYVYLIAGTHDSRDLQLSLFVSDGQLTRGGSFVQAYAATATPGVLDYDEALGWLIRVPEEPGDFTLYVSLLDSAAGAAWAPFDFEVLAP